MKTLLQHLESKVIINDLLVKNMKYEVQLKFREASKQVQARALAKKINTQLDTALIGLKNEEKEEIRKRLIASSFMVVPNPISDHIDYRHVFTQLTNYDPTTEATYLRLIHWLNLNIDREVDPKVVENYVLKYKVHQDETLFNRVNKKPPVIEPEPVYIDKSRGFSFKWLMPIFLIVVILFLGNMGNNINSKSENLYGEPIKIESIIESSNLDSLNYDFIQDRDYNYQPLNLVAIYNYLSEEKNSMLTRESYLSTLDRLAESYDTHPLLLIAIIGHEQNFVPSDHEKASEIINNPYNVFESWLEFNTNFEESTTIALNTIETAKESWTKDKSFLEHLNQTYAEDPNWHKGVQSIFNKLKDINKTSENN